LADFEVASRIAHVQPVKGLQPAQRSQSYGWHFLRIGPAAWHRQAISRRVLRSH